MDHKDPKTSFEYVCPRCVFDPYDEFVDSKRTRLKEFIDRTAESKHCDWCGAQSNKPIAAPIVRVGGHLRDCIRLDYEEVPDGEYWNDDRRAHSPALVDTATILFVHRTLVLPRDETDSHKAALLAVIGEHSWVRRKNDVHEEPEEPTDSDVSQ